MLVGEEGIPREIIEKLPDHHLQTFMREPDPDKWPTEMEHLVQYLTEEERGGSAVSDILVRHDELLRSSLEPWVSSVWQELTEEQASDQRNAQLIFDEALKRIKRLLWEQLESRQKGVFVLDKR